MQLKGVAVPRGHKGGVSMDVGTKHEPAVKEVRLPPAGGGMGVVSADVGGDLQCVALQEVGGGR